METKHKITIGCAAFVFIGGIVAALIGLIEPGKDPELKLIDVTSHLLQNKDGDDAICCLDLKLKNSGKDSSYLKRIEIELVELVSIQTPRIPSNTDKCTVCHGGPPPIDTYSVDVSTLKRGDKETINIALTVPPHSTRRIVVKLGGKSIFGRVVATVLADEDTMLQSQPIDIIIVDQDLSFAYKEEKIPLNDIVIKPDLLEEILTADKRDEILRYYRIEMPDWANN